jgi:signal peptidase II
MEKKFNLLKVIMDFIMAGAIGNLIDRIFIGYVTDFIYVELIDFPVFNIADSYITVAAFLLVILSLFYYKDEDFAFLEKLIPFKKNKDQDNSKQ